MKTKSHAIKYFFLGEPLINISSTPPSNKLPIGAAINLTCSAWQTEELAKKAPRTRLQRIEWFDPRDRRIGDECRAESPAAASMKCTRMIGALTEEKFGNYTCKASNGYNYCSNKRFSITLQGKHRQHECLWMKTFNVKFKAGGERKVSALTLNVSIFS